MGSIIDMHVHTMVGSLDSDLSPKGLAEQVRAVGLTGVVLTEHLYPWRRGEIDRFRNQYGIFVFNAQEWATEMGHIAVLGLPQEVRGVRRVRDLRAACDEYGAFMVLCHPFRYFPGPSNFLFADRRDSHTLGIEELAEHPVFSLTDAVEVMNGGCIDRENGLARDVAVRLNLRQTAGSDAHMPLEVGRYATLFEKDIESEEDMLQELHAGRFRPVQRISPGHFAPPSENGDLPGTP